MSTINVSPRTRTIILLIAAGIGVFFLFEISGILSPFIWAAVTAYVFSPLITRAQKATNLPRLLLVALVYVAVGSLTVVAILSLMPVINSQFAQARHELPAFLKTIQRDLWAGQTIQIAGFTVDLSAFNTQVSTWVGEIGNSVGRSAIPVIRGVFTGLISLLVYLVTTFYLLLDSPKLVSFLIRLVPDQHRGSAQDLLDRVNRTLGAYVRGQLLLVVIMTAATFPILTILDIRYALVIAIATGFLELIPLVGPYSAGGIAVAVALLQPTTPFGWSHLMLGIVVALCYFLLRMVEDYLIIPKVIGKIVHLHPLLVIFVVMAGAAIGGIMGLLLAVPIAAVIKVVATYFFPRVFVEEAEENVPLEVDEDLESLVEKLRKLKKKRIWLVAPAGAPILRDRASVRKLRKASKELGLEMSIVSSDALACSLAQSVGFSTLPAVSEQQS